MQGKSSPRCRRLPASLFWAVAVASLAFSCLGVAVDFQIGGVQRAADGGDAGRAIAQLESASWLEADPLVRAPAIGALFSAREYQAVLDATGEGFPTTADSRLYRALAQIALNDDEGAEDTLRRVLHDRPYDIDLYEAVRGYISENAGNAGNSEGEGGAQGVESARDAESARGGLPASFLSMLNEEARRANELAVSERAAWLSSQRTVELV